MLLELRLLELLVLEKLAELGAMELQEALVEVAALDHLEILVQAEVLVIQEVLEVQGIYPVFQEPRLITSPAPEETLETLETLELTAPVGVAVEAVEALEDTLQAILL